MNSKLFNPDYLQFLCDKYNLKPNRKYGQNFLINSEVIEKIIESAGIDKNDTVVEIGPGFGALTFALAETAGKVIAFEIEQKIKDYWNKNKPENVEIIWGNVLKELDPSPVCRTADSRFRGNDNQTHCHPREDGDPSSIRQKTDFSLHGNDGYKVVANLPYQITSNIIRKFLEADNPPREMVIMTQKEVAERICAEPGGMSLLAIATQYYAYPEIIAAVSRSDFWPEPKVDSAILKLTIIEQEINKSETENLFKVARAGFAQKRKLLIKNLTPLFGNKEILREIFTKIGLGEKVRAQELSVEQWKMIAERLSSRSDK